jgi:hypothetical protein
MVNSKVELMLKYDYSTTYKTCLYVAPKLEIKIGHRQSMGNIV